MIRRRKIGSGSLPPEGDGGVAAFLGHVPSRKKRASVFASVVEEAERRAASGDWDGATGRVFVGLYGVCHRMVYGVTPDELEDPNIFSRYARQANTFLHVSMEDDAAAMAEFIRWTWTREASREKWAATQSISRNRLGPGLQFSARLLTDYRVEQSRQHGK